MTDYRKKLLDIRCEFDLGPFNYLINYPIFKINKTGNLVVEQNHERLRGAFNCFIIVRLVTPPNLPNQQHLLVVSIREKLFKYNV